MKLVFSVFWVLPPGEAFFGPLKAGNLFISVVATLRFPIKAVEFFFAICATSYYPTKEKILRAVIYQFLFRNRSKSEKLSEIKPPLIDNKFVVQ